MTNISLTLDQLAEITGIEQDELSSQILNEESGKTKEGFESELSGIIRNRINEARKQGVNRGFEKKGKKIERALKPLFAKYDVDLQDIEYAEEAIEQLTEQLENISSEQTPNAGLTDLKTEELLKLPQVKQLIIERTKELEQAKNQLEQQAQSALAEKDQYITLSEFRKFARQQLNGKNPVALNDNTIEMLYNQHKDSVKFKDGKLQLTNKEGETLEDDNFQPVDPAKWIESTWANIYGFSEVPTGHTSPPPNPAGQQSGRTVHNFRSVEEYNNALKSAGSDFKKKNEIIRAYADQLEKEESE